MGCVLVLPLYGVKSQEVCAPVLINPTCFIDALLCVPDDRDANMHDADSIFQMLTVWQRIYIEHLFIYPSRIY